MSAFDKRVCEWLNSASIPIEKKQLVLNRISVGIQNYRALELDPAHNPETSTMKANKYMISRPPVTRRKDGKPMTLYETQNQSLVYAPPPTYIDIDFSLQQRISKALIRLQEGDEGSDESLLFPMSILKPPIHDSLINSAYPEEEYVSDGKVSAEAAGDGNGEFKPFETLQTPSSEMISQNKSNSLFIQRDDTSIKDATGSVNQDGVSSVPGTPAPFKVNFTFGVEAKAGNDATHSALYADENFPDDSMSEHEDTKRRLALRRKSRNAICAEHIDLEEVKDFQVTKIPKSDSYKQTILRALEQHNLFSFLDDNDLENVADIMKIERFDTGETITTKMQPTDKFYVLVEGRVKITQTTAAKEYNDLECMMVGRTLGSLNDSSNSVLQSSPVASPGDMMSNGDSTRAGMTLDVGSTFGDLALMYNCLSPETVEVASVEKSEGAVLCIIDRLTYKIICTKASQAKRIRYTGFLSKVKFLQSLTEDEKLRLVDALKSAKYKKGDKIIEYGDDGKWFNIIVEGEVDVIGRDANGKQLPVCTFKTGDSIGELEFLFNHKTVADCIASSNVVKTAKMAKNHFEKVIGPAKEILERQANDSEVYSYYRHAQKNFLK